MASAYANIHAPFLLWRAKSAPLAHHVIHADNWLFSAEARAIQRSEPESRKEGPAAAREGDPGLGAEIARNDAEPTAQLSDESLVLTVPSPDRAAAALKACLSTSSSWWPQQIGPQTGWLEHAPFVFWILEALRPRVLVELGTHGGYSYFSFCQAVQQLAIDTRCFAVDTWRGDEHAGFYGEDVYDEVRARHDRLYAAFSTLIRSTFDDALLQFGNGTIDLLHIDGRHTYADVKHDFESWKPKLSTRSVVLFHDTNVRERDFGIWLFWRDLSARYPYFEFVHGHGLGVLGFGSEVPGSVRDLFAASADDAARTQIREAYSRLGSAISLEMRAGTQSAALAQQTAALAQPIAAASAAQTHAEQLAAALHARTAELASPIERMAASEATAESARQWTAQADQELAGRSKELDAVRADLVETKRRASDLEARTEAAEAEVRALSAAVAASEARASVFQSTVAAYRNSTSWRVTAPLRSLRRLLWRLGIVGL